MKDIVKVVSFVFVAGVICWQSMELMDARSECRKCLERESEWEDEFGCHRRQVPRKLVPWPDPISNNQ